MCKQFLTAGVALFLGLTPLLAQDPPLSLQWTITLPYGSSEELPARFSIDEGITYWMLSDDFNNWSLSEGVIRRYDANGLALNGYQPEQTSIGCTGTLDHPIDLFVRNDSIWGIAYWQQIQGSDVFFCAQGPGGGWIPDNSANGFELKDGVHSMLLTADRRYLCAWHETSFTQTDSRVVALDLSDNVIWDIMLPENAYGAVQIAAQLGDSLAAAAFPELYWLDLANGLHTSTTQLYAGGSGNGVVLREGNDLYWAANDANVVHFGKLDQAGNAVWSGTAPVITVNAIAVDDLGRLWIGGNDATEGRLIKVEANGSYTDSYSNGATITDLDFSNGRLSWTGRISANEAGSYLVNSIPEP